MQWWFFGLILALSHGCAAYVATQVSAQMLPPPPVLHQSPQGDSMDGFNAADRLVLHKIYQLDKSIYAKLNPLRFEQQILDAPLQ
jgi:hypothetical protein